MATGNEWPGPGLVRIPGIEDGIGDIRLRFAEGDPSASEPLTQQTLRGKTAKLATKCIRSPLNARNSSRFL